MSKELTKEQKRIRTYLAVISFVLFTIFVIGLFWLATNPAQTVTLTLSYAAGLSMIVLPCTLPLVFVIVPLSMSENYKKGFFMALLFSLGLIITLTLYGVVVALAGQIFALTQVIQVMFVIAGILAFIFGLSELKLLGFQMPSYGKFPSFVQKQPDYFKALFLGLFLGNAGVGCPNPATYVILIYIAATGSIIEGAALQFVNGIGRAVPLLFFSILGILGVNVIGGIVKRKATITKATGWGLAFIGAFILINGLPAGHEWYERTFVHEGWNKLVTLLGLPSELEMGEHEHVKTILEQQFEPFIPWIFLVLLAIPIILYYYKTRIKKQV